MRNSKKDSEHEALASGSGAETSPRTGSGVLPSNMVIYTIKETRTDDHILNETGSNRDSAIIERSIRLFGNNKGHVIVPSDTKKECIEGPLTLEGRSSATKLAASALTSKDEGTRIQEIDQHNAYG
jgi:hypothetical protein